MKKLRFIMKSIPVFLMLFFCNANAENNSNSTMTQPNGTTTTTTTSAQPNVATITTTAATPSKPEDANKMMPPKALDNKVYNSMVGTWVGDSDIMGTKMHDVFKIRWDVNHQYLILDLKSRGAQNPKMTYQGLGVFGVDGQGQAKIWWFDSWGADAASTGTGTFSDNKLEISDGNKMYKETRSFEIKGNQMQMHSKGTSTMNGKETPYEQNVIYKKK